ncbi:MAG TPA: nitroreductase family protein [Bacteroidales bacterium]|nr:nitroreductase family protein [Bacteroidales bacterium]
MEYSELIRLRESVRNYDPSKPVPHDTLTRILDAGRVAPSANNLQPWRFLVISSPVMLEKIHKCYKREWFANAPLILVIAGEKDHAWVRRYDGYNSLETDLAIAMTHIILAATDEGVGTCWIAAFDPKILGEVLGLDDNHIVYSITPLGFPEDGYQKPARRERKSLDEIVEYL